MSIELTLYREGHRLAIETSTLEEPDMYCGKCGALNADDSSFCTHCGSALASNTKRTALDASESRTVRGEYAAPNSDALLDHAPSPTALPRNDYQPNTVDPRAEITRQGFDTEAWAAVIGPRNTQYYLKRFENQFRTGKQSRWHWPAFLWTFAWLIYRKLWGWAAVSFFAPYAVVFAVALLVASSPNNPDSASATIWLWGCYWVAAIFGPPMIANALYYTRCRKVLERHQSVASRERYLAQLVSSGGTSNVAAFIGIAFFVVFIGGILAAIAIPAYQDYSKRAKTSETILLAGPARTVIESYYKVNKRLPSAAEFEQLFPNRTSRYVESMRYDEATGKVTIAVRTDENAGAAGFIYLVPNEDAAGNITWLCGSNSAFRKYTPGACRANLE